LSSIGIGSALLQSLDRFYGGGSESIVLRRLLLAVLFCLAVWAVTDRTSAARGDSADVTMASTIGATVATPPIDTHPPEARWEALLPAGLASGSSRSHQLQAQAVDLPGVSSRVPWPVARRADADRHAARFRPAHLLNTPLLI
jgi:hypothetical protein